MYVKANVYQMTYGSDISQCIKIDKIIVYYTFHNIPNKRVKTEPLLYPRFEV